MPRKRRPEEHVNLERWLVSYADFITLLFAFFVVMYAISSVNEGKYRVLSDTLNEVFQSQPRTLQPIQIGEDGVSGDPSLLQADSATSAQPSPRLLAPPQLNTCSSPMSTSTAWPGPGRWPVMAGSRRKTGRVPGDVVSVRKSRASCTVPRRRSSPTPGRSGSRGAYNWPSPPDVSPPSWPRAFGSSGKAGS